MGKKKEKKKKKINPRKERYAKFHKDKPSALDISMPDLEPEEQKMVKQDEGQITTYLKRRIRVPEKYISERKAKSKR